MKRSESLGKFNQVLLMGFLLFGGLYFAQGYLIPIFIAALISMLFLPVCERLEKWGFKRVFAIIICILIFIGFLTGIGFLLGTQIAGFSQDLPQLQEKFEENFLKLKEEIAESTEVSQEQLQEWARNSMQQIGESLGSYLQSILTISTGILIDFFLILIYIGFFLAYREKIERFLIWISDRNEEEKTVQIVKDCTRVSVSYLAGILTVMFILAVCNTIALTSLGIEHALFFAVLAAILNLIPFIGSFTGSIFPIFMAILTKDELWIPLAIAIYFTVIQYIESYFLTPFIVGGKVKVNPLAEILALVLGGVLWGIPGLILFIPLIGLVKVLFDHVEKLQPYGYVIGREDTPSTDQMAEKVKKWVKKRFGKK